MPIFASYNNGDNFDIRIPTSKLRLFKRKDLIKQIDIVTRKTNLDQKTTYLNKNMKLYFPNLNFLTISFCYYLRSFPNDFHCPNLKILELYINNIEPSLNRGIFKSQDKYLQFPNFLQIPLLEELIYSCIEYHKNNIPPILPKNINIYKNLKRLYLQNNNLKSIQELNLPNLEILVLSYNQLSFLPLFILPNLQELDISHNKISSLNNLNAPMLESLCCNDNRFSSFVDLYAPNLKYLNCLNNKLIEFPLFEKLSVIQINNFNHIKYIAPHIIFSNLTSIVSIDIPYLLVNKFPIYIIRYIESKNSNNCNINYKQNMKIEKRNIYNKYYVNKYYVINLMNIIIDIDFKYFDYSSIINYIYYDPILSHNCKNILLTKSNNKDYITNVLLLQYDEFLWGVIEKIKTFDNIVNHDFKNFLNYYLTNDNLLEIIITWFINNNLIPNEIRYNTPLVYPL